ncbi:Mismatch repair ATPase MSH6 (MutS family) [Phaffia rhodozyma]|uniref:DNA mismatch repair protein n=1 Tax=Phaffia rhodozyma TaxID=264483 RepID=A0A0F7SQQ4_PHARH|nr:Mismatch repair ATPase MSH6 (MutS family) [Phaffia rhodozyma]
MSKANATPKDKKQTTLLGFFSKSSSLGPPSSSPSRPLSSASNLKSATPSTLTKSRSVGGGSALPHPPSSSPLAASSALKSRQTKSLSGKPLSSKDDPFTIDEVEDDHDVEPITEAKKTIMTEKLEKDERGGEKALSETSSRLSPFPSSSLSEVDMNDKEKNGDPVAMDGVEEDEDEEFPVGRSQRVKRKINFVESDLSDADDEEPKKPKAITRKGSKKAKAVSSDDEFKMGSDEEALLAAAASEFDKYEPDDSFSAEDTPKAKSKQQKPKAPTRPPPRPIPSGTSSSNTGNGSNSMLTAAEQRKQQNKDDKKAAEDCFDFLKTIKDKEGHTTDHPEYDPRTLYIPKSAWNKFTPFETQFWNIKQYHYDTILFFQKGKFFELYENDAQTGFLEFGLKMTDRVKMKMVGVPEQNFEMWAAKFLAAGYKVGRVEQSETALGAEMRMKASGGKAQIVNRELKHVLTNGTVSDPSYLAGDEANHCISIKEDSSNLINPSFGITVLDAATGAFSLSAFEDDVCKTKLETMFRQLRPKELIHEKGNLSVSTLRTLRSIISSSCAWTAMKPQTDFTSAANTLDILSDFFALQSEGSDKQAVLPEVIEKFREEPLAIESLGGLVSYLKQLNLDKDLLSQKNFDIYDPIRQNKSLILNGNTLAHIEVLVNSEGGEEGTLLDLLQKCRTPFGKRLFRVWLCHPLRDIQAINARLDAVDELMEHPTFITDFRELAKGVPDLERMISRIHAGSIKIADFMKVLKSFEIIQKRFEKLRDISTSFESTSVATLLGSAPDLSSYIENVRTMFTFDKDDGTLLPADGRDEAYEEIIQELETLEDQLEGLREKFSKQLKTEVVYWHSAQGQKEIFQLAVPSSKKVPSNWTKTSGTKAQNRYYAPETLPIIRKIQEARETRGQVVRSFVNRLYAEFDKERSVWLSSVKTLAELDCLCSLATASLELDQPKCRPTFVDSDQAFLKFESLRHPSMCLRADFIPNDVELGGDKARISLLTGPNMAGKSTLLRTTAAGVIMAQLGMYVGAESATLSPLDCIMTRMGAMDNMFSQSSTFKVELDECAKILRECGPKSLCILDELGRGTSTYDGMAIAGAVLHHLAGTTLPLGFFATHYGTLTDDFAYHPNIRAMHMQTQVDEEKREVTFLYKLIQGKAESSHGTHVAHLAGVPLEVVSRAETISSTFFKAQQSRLSAGRRTELPLVVHGDFARLVKLGLGLGGNEKEEVKVGGVEVFRYLREGIKRTLEQAATVGSG